MTTAEIAFVAPLIAALLSLPMGDRYPPLNLTPQQQRAKMLEALLGIMVVKQGAGLVGAGLLLVAFGVAAERGA